MPKVAKSDISKINKIIDLYPNEFLRNPTNELFCNMCHTIVNHSKMYFVETHRSTARHIKQSNLDNVRKQKFIVMNKPDFVKNVLKAFLSADIPLWKLRNKQLKHLFESIGQPLPSDQTCRLQLENLYAEEMNRIKDFIRNEPMFLMIDETQISGRRFVNIIVGKLEFPDKTLLFDCSPQSGPVNAESILRNIDDAIVSLGVSRLNFNLLLTDAASYMVSAGKILHSLYPHLFHVTCIAHLIHNCALKVRAQFADVDNLIASVKNAIVKNKTRTIDFHDIGIPPDTIITRWGSWLHAALYYSRNLSDVQRIVRNWSGNGILVSRARNSVETENLVYSLIDIENCYKPLINVIFNLENSKCTILESFNAVLNLNFDSDPCNISKYVHDRLEKNEIMDIVYCRRTEISPHLYSLLQKCQSTSSAIERSFSMLKKILEKDRIFKEENIRKYFLTHYNSIAFNSE